MCIRVKLSTEQARVFYVAGFGWSTYRIWDITGLTPAEAAELMEDNISDDIPYGIEYSNIQGLPCAEGMVGLQTVRDANLGIFGAIEDIICDRGEVIENDCSGPLCLPPPPYCVVDPAFSLTDPMLGHMHFLTIDEALFRCETFPILDIRLEPDGTLHETPVGGLVIRSNSAAQTKL